jgi:hypothetical protein
VHDATRTSMHHPEHGTNFGLILTTDEPDETN